MRVSVRRRLGVDPRPGCGLYNFAPAVRPVKMDAHIRGFPGRHYCPRMATMNKPTYQVCALLLARGRRAAAVSRARVSCADTTELGFEIDRARPRARRSDWKRPPRARATTRLRLCA